MLDRRGLLGSAAGLALSSCVGLPLPGEQRSLRLATFNIWHDQGDWSARLPLLVAALRSVDADVIALQEVLEDAGKRLPNQADTLAAALGHRVAGFSSTDAEGAPRRYGNAILTRLPVVDTASRKLEPLDDYRTALRVRVRLGSKPVDIVNTHLAWQDDAGPVRARQVADLFAWLPNDGTPLIVTGDFNAPLTDAGLAALTSSRFVSALAPGAVPTTLNPAMKHPHRVIDHIFAEQRWFAVTDARRIGDQPVGGIYPSDHFGVAATLSFGG